jgi:hypothetical protein
MQRLGDGHLEVLILFAGEVLEQTRDLLVAEDRQRHPGVCGGRPGGVGPSEGQRRRCRCRECGGIGAELSADRFRRDVLGKGAVSAKKRRVLSWVVEEIAPLVQDYAQVHQ